MVNPLKRLPAALLLSLVALVPQAAGDVAVARTATGLLHQADGSLTGWTNAGGWTSDSDPAMVCFGATPVPAYSPWYKAAIRDPFPGNGEYVSGIREPSLFVENGRWQLTADSEGQHLYLSADRGRTMSRTDARPSVHTARVGGGAITGYANGWPGKFGSTYYVLRVAIDSGSGPYYIDSWSTTVDPTLAVQSDWIAGNTYKGTGGWSEVGHSVQPGSVLFDGASTYYQVVSGENSSGVNSIGLLSCPSPIGPYTRVDPAICDATNAGLNGRIPENTRAFVHPGLGRVIVLANGGHDNANDRNVQVVSPGSSLTDWTGATVRQHQRVCPLDTTVGAVGTSGHFTGPDAALVYDATTGYVPIVYDCDPRSSQASSWVDARTVRYAALEPSALALRYSGSGDTTSRSLSRTLAHTDLVVELIAQATAWNGSGGSLTVEYRSDGSGNAYRARAGKDGFVSLYKVTGGSETLLAAGSGATYPSVQTTEQMTFSSTYMLQRFKVQVLGNVHKGYIDGDLQYSYTDSSSPIASGTALALTGKGLDCDVRCLSARTSDLVTVTGLTPGLDCYLRGPAGIPYGSILADASGTGTITVGHSPQLFLEVGGVDYTPTGGIWGGDTLQFTGLSQTGPARLSIGGLAR